MSGARKSDGPFERASVANGQRRDRLTTPCHLNCWSHRSDIDERLQRQHRPVSPRYAYRG